jgi:hypothetical protein
MKRSRVTEVSKQSIVDAQRLGGSFLSREQITYNIHFTRNMYSFYYYDVEEHGGKDIDLSRLLTEFATKMSVKSPAERGFGVTTET